MLSGKAERKVQSTTSDVVIQVSSMVPAVECGAAELLFHDVSGNNEQTLK